MDYLLEVLAAAPASLEIVSGGSPQLEVMSVGGTLLEVLPDAVPQLEIAIGLPGPVGPQGPQGPLTPRETNPAFTYADGVLIRVDYASGNYKTLAYTGGILTQVDYVQGAAVTRKILVYGTGGTLAGVIESVL